MYTIIPYHTTLKKQWDNFVTQGNTDTFLFYRNFMDYHSDRFTDASVLVYKQEMLIALFPANTVGTRIFSHQGLTYGDFICKSNIKTTDYVGVYKAVLHYYYSSGKQYVTIKALPSIYQRHIQNITLPYIGFKLKADIIEVNLRSVLQLDNFKLSNSRKEGVKRAKHHKLQVQESSTFSTFWTTILIPNLRTKHKTKPVHSLDEISKLKTKFPNNIRQFNVLYNNAIVAGATVFEMNNTLNIQYISGNHLNSTLGSIDYLHYYLISQRFKQKKYIDFGTSNLNKGQHINEGLLFWKEGFAARSIPQTTYSIATKNYTLLNQTFI